MEDNFTIHDCKSGIRIEYSRSYTCEGPNDKKEIKTLIQAFDKNNHLLDKWEFVMMRLDPYNPNSKERFYNSTNQQLRKSGYDLLDKVLKKH
jgi:hypothetical protein